MKKISKSLELLLNIAKADAVISRRLNSQSLGFGDVALLYYISQAPEGKIRRVDLAEKLGVTASGVTRTLLPLEKIGVVKREVNERDARVSLTMLTASGKKMLEESIQKIEEVCPDLMPGLKDSDSRKFSEILMAISR